ncbi:MAG: alpha/beta hydrolase [Rhodospirillales bacterium]|nr:alpha/beta hydrolase [Rhodospirillales bacterium]
MTSSPVYRTYTQEALDTQYNNRAAVPEFASFVERWQAESLKTRERFAGDLDIAYGSGRAERLDVFRPDGSSSGAPVHLFFHGGYWSSRDKSEYSFLAPVFTSAGAVFMVVEYPLIPAVGMDELVRACRAAVAWAYHNAASYGGDRDKIYVSGHSAGGHLVAMLMAAGWTNEANLPNDAVKGGISLSGLFNLEPIRLSYLNGTLGLNPDTTRRNSPLYLSPATPAPLVLAYGGAESDEYHRQSGELHAAWKNQGADAQIMERPGLNHFTILDDFTAPASPLTRAALSQMGLA